MKSIITLTFLFFTCISYAQTTTPFKFLEANNVRAMVSSRGCVSNNFATGQPSYEIPKGDGTHTVYEISPIWSAHVNGNIKCAYNPYNLAGNMLGPVSNQYSSNWHQDMRNIFSVSESLANTHMTDWNQIGYVFPQAILDWPANGNPSEGTDLFLAPFEDVDGNLEYNPQNGDYPIVKGDDNVYSIYHYDSIYNTTNSSVGVEYPLEVRQNTYQYATNDERNNTTYISFTVVNRGTETLEDFKFGFFIDFDLGGPNDDYIGTDSLRNLFYVYNGDNLDADDGGANGYQSAPPAFGIQTLNHDLHATTILDDTEPLIHITTPATLNYIMDGFYTDSSPFLNSNNQPIKMIFKGDPNVGGSESEIELSNIPGDRRAMLSMKPVELAPNEQICYEIALVYGRGSDHLESVSTLQNVADQIQTYYDNGQSLCWDPPAYLNVEEVNTERFEAKVYPNPFTQNFNIESNSNLKSVEIININGQTIEVFNPKTTQTQINTSSYAPGMYFVKIIDQENNLRTYRVIKR